MLMIKMNYSNRDTLPINAQPKLYNSLASTFLDFFVEHYVPTHNENNN
ncbi:MAG: hypothetical protein QM762_24860 [Chryseolinea sp.]